MIATLYEADRTVARCLSLIERHAPRLMRIGGGHLVGENVNVGRRVPAAVAERMAELRRAHWSMLDIAAETGYTQATVSNYLRRHGFAPRRLRRLTQNQIDRIFALRAEGLTHGRIAHAVGCKESTVTKWLSGAHHRRKVAESKRRPA